jgi:hypothetical protein
MSEHPPLRRLLAGMILGLAAALIGCQHETPPAATESAPPPAAPAAVPLSLPHDIAPVAPAGDAASGQPVVQTGVLIHSAANPMYCIDAAQSRSAKHPPVRLFTCHGQENQRWSLAAGAERVTTLVGVGGLCLEIRGRAVQLSACTGHDDQKLNYDGGGRLRDLTTGKCLTVTRAARGAPILMAACDPGNPGQVWSLADR